MDKVVVVRGDVQRARALMALQQSLAAIEDDISAVLVQATGSAATLLGDAAALWIAVGESVELRAFSHHDPDTQALMKTVFANPLHSPNGLVASVVRHGHVVRATSEESLTLLGGPDSPYRAWFNAYGIAGMVLVPLVSRGVRVGAVGIAREQGGEPFDDEDVAFLEQIGHVVGHAVATARLLDQVVVAEQRASLMAREDHLTGLLNRRGFLEVLRQLPAEQSALVAIIDMDGFKLVNDGFGHAAGDMVLASMAARLCAAVPPSTPVARIGGDEFAILVTADDDEEAAEIVEHAVQECTGTISVVGLLVPVTVSVGTAVPQIAHGDEALLQADLAMARAKKRGGVVAAYDPRLDDPATRRLRDVLDLRRAVTGSDLVVHYQPVVAVNAGPMRVEALVRRAVGDRLVLPGLWLDLAARAGLMPELTANVVMQVVDQLSRWWNDGLEVECAVNIPAPVLAAPEAVTALLTLVDQAGLPRRALSVEVTEGDLVGKGAKAALTRCHDADISVAVDDFGTGWSALSYLVDLPLRTLKIDKSFVDGIDLDHRRASIVRAVIEVGHQLGLRVVAEGVETANVADTLIDLGADSLQGFLFGRATSAAEVELVLRGGLVASHR